MDIIDPCHDLISELPQDVIEIILTKLPIQYAVRTCILSRRWRYKWTSMTHVLIDDSTGFHDKLIHFVKGFLSMHDGPIHKFNLSTKYNYGDRLEADQWLLTVCQKDVKELTVRLAKDCLFRVPPYIFSFKELSHLALNLCELEPPPHFAGFSCMKHLDLKFNSIPRKHVERLISTCTLLESLKLAYCKSSRLTIRAPNLKCLNLEGLFEEIYLENTPLLVDITLNAHWVKDTESNIADFSSCYHMEKLLGSVPKLERLCGKRGFTQPLSAGPGGREFITYNLLKQIELSSVNFGSGKEVLVALQLIFSSPNLQELMIKCRAIRFAPSDCSPYSYLKDPFFVGRTMDRLKLAKISTSVIIWEPICMNVIKFLLGCSPSLLSMNIEHPRHMNVHRLSEWCAKISSLPRASPKASIGFSAESDIFNFEEYW